MVIAIVLVVVKLQINLSNMKKEEFIGKYLDSDKKLKNHNLPYGMEYFNLVADTEDKAEKKWEQNQELLEDLETVSDLANQIADWIGVYGSCKDECNKDGCELSKNNVMCCRVGFMVELEERIRQAAENDILIEKRNLRSLIQKKVKLNISKDFEVKK